MRSRSLSADISYSPAIQDSQHGYLYARVFDNRASQLFNCLPHLLQSWSSHLTFCNRSPPSFLSCECCCILICLPAFRQQKSRNDSLIFLASVVSCEPVSFLLWKEIIKFSKIKPAVYHSQGVVILLVQSYKLNGVCNAEVCHIQAIPTISTKGCAQKSITREV